MAYQLSLSDYSTLLCVSAEAGDIARFVDVYGTMIRNVLGMQRVFSCTAEYVDPKFVTVGDKQMPSCVCVRYQTPDKRRGMALAVHLNYLPPDELEKRLTTMKQQAIAVSIQGTAAMNGGVANDEMVAEITRRVEAQIEGQRNSYRPSVQSHAFYTGAWPTGASGERMIVPGVVDQDFTGTISNCMKCDKVMFGLGQQIVILPENDTAFLLNALYEDRNRR